MTQLIDPIQLHEFTENDDGLLADLAIIFSRAAPDYLAKLNLCIAEADSTGIGEVSHQIKSQLNYFFCQTLIEKAVALEQFGSQGRTQDAAELSKQLADGIDQLLCELSQLTGLNLSIEED